MNLPNKLTVIRILLIPFFLICFEVNFAGHALTALVIFVIASVTDFLDGYIARRDHLITDFGKFMDPLADKLLTASAFVCLTSIGFIPAWVVVIILAREFAITGLRLVAASDGIVLAAGIWGKFKTVSQMIAIILLLLYLIPQLRFNWLWILGQVAVYVCTALTLWSGLDYFLINKDIFKNY